MKLNLKKIILFFLVLFIFVGCTNISESVSEKEAKQLVIENHTKDIGTPEIISIEIKSNNYIVEWENKGNKEWGIDKVTKDGEVKMVERRIE